MTSEPSSSAAGVRAIALAFGTAALCTGASYASPALSDLQPWHPGDPLPVVAKLLPTTRPRVVEDDAGQLVEASLEPEPAPPAVELAAGAPALPPHPPGVPQALVDADHRGMDHYYRALARVTAGEGLARAAHYGDSTIAADGIAGTVRERLQARFGYGGPGFLAAGMDGRWMVRPDVGVGREGEWSIVSLLEGGGEGRYGYAGIAATATTDAKVGFSPRARADGQKPVLHHLDVYWRGGEGGGSWWASADGKGAGSGSAAGKAPFDSFTSRDFPDGFKRVTLGTQGGPVTLYGVVMETKGPGVVWDTLGVTGVGSASFTQQYRKHLQRQLERRAPDLVVIMLGGNELGYPTLEKGDGSGYVPYFQDAIRRIRAGVPDSSCLIVTPVDQGTRSAGKVKTKPALPRLVGLQRQIAATEGCAFWDAFAAMGGEGAVARWMALKPPLAWTDMIHLSEAGQRIIGDMLADAIEAGFDQWTNAGGVARPVPPPPGPPAAAPAPAPATP